MNCGDESCQGCCWLTHEGCLALKLGIEIEKPPVREV